MARVIKVDSAESWNFYMSQAKTQGCPWHDKDFKEIVIYTWSKIVAHFTATWCAPSVFMNSFFEELALSYKDALFLIVDVDEVKEVANRLEVKAMPTFMFLKDGNAMDKLVGANPDEIKKRVDGFVHSSRVVLNV